MEITRLAPSPTGALHLGNARTFLINWALARQKGWKIVLRIEDLDGPRIKPEAVSGIQDTLRWLGIDWDEGPLIQSDDLGPYRAAIEELAKKGLAFPCELTRAQIASAASAPQQGAHELHYAASLRPQNWEKRFHDAATNWRLFVPDAPISVADGFAGPRKFNPAKIVGDFIVWTKRGVPAYQLAVVVDDHRQGITQIVRGDDLLDSAARQLLLYRALGLSPQPSYAHLPLVVGQDGKRLSKRHGDTRVDLYRSLGVPPQAVIGLLARWCGLKPENGLMSPKEFLSAFELSRVPKAPVVITPDDDALLREKASRS